MYNSHFKAYIFASTFIVACSPAVKQVTASSGEGAVSQAETGLIDDSSQEPSDDIPLELGEAPYIVAAIGIFSDYPNIGKVIEIQVDYLDEQDDVDDGFLHLNYQSSQASGNESFHIDGHEVIDSEGTVTMAFKNANSNLIYAFTVMLEDAEGHLSQQIEFDVIE